MTDSNGGLKDWIREEMTVSEEKILNQHKERIARVLGVTREGGVFFKIDKNVLDAEAQIGAYLIGRLFARVAGYADRAAVRNRELEDDLQMPPGTVRGTLTRMRRRGSAQPRGDGLHRVPINSIPRLLDHIESQLT